MDTKSTLILLVRHGKATTTGKVLPGRAKGLELSDMGHKQATEVASYLKTNNYDVSAIYSSPMERTIQTATPIATKFDHELQIEAGLNEADFGDWTGAELEELRKLPEWKTVQSTPSKFRFPNGESFVEMQIRISETLDSLASKHARQTIVTVSHADMIKAALAHYLGLDLDKFQRLIVNPCSISAIYVGDRPSVLFMNQSTSGKPDFNIG